MAGKDITEKALLAYNDVFADIVNNLLFHGEQFIGEDELEQGRERSVYMGDKSLREQERDNSKFWRKNDIRIAFIGAESETEADDSISFRVIGYDGASYRDQICYEYNENGKRVRRMTRYPVITIVLYFGYKKRWDKAKSLYEVMGDGLIEELKPYVHDYKVNLFEIAFLNDKQVAGFKSDFRFVADYFVQKRKTGDYVGSKEEVKHIREVLQLLSAVADEKRFRMIANTMGKGGEPGTMCEVLDRIEAKGREKGLKEGKKEGKKEGLRQGEERLGKLGQALIEAGRNEDLLKAMKSTRSRAKLYKEFGL